MSTTTVSVTVTDPSNQAWSNGLISWSLAANKPVFYNGTELPENYFKPTPIALDEDGSASFTVPDCAQLTPANTLYKITVNPNASATGTTLNLFITGSSMDISDAVNAAITTPAVVPLAIPYAYADDNISLGNGIGKAYYNTGTDVGLRVFDGTDWQAIGGGQGNQLFQKVTNSFTEGGTLELASGVVVVGTVPSPGTSTINTITWTGDEIPSGYTVQVTLLITGNLTTETGGNIQQAYNFFEGDTAIVTFDSSGNAYITPSGN